MEDVEESGPMGMSAIAVSQFEERDAEVEQRIVEVRWTELAAEASGDESGVAEGFGIVPVRVEAVAQVPVMEDAEESGPMGMNAVAVSQMEERERNIEKRTVEVRWTELAAEASGDESGVAEGFGIVPVRTEVAAQVPVIEDVEESGPMGMNVIAFEKLGELKIKEEIADLKKSVAAELDWAIADFEKVRFQEEPNTDREFAAAEGEVVQRQAAEAAALAKAERVELGRLRSGVAVEDAASPVEFSREMAFTALEIDEFPETRMVADLAPHRQVNFDLEIKQLILDYEEGKYQSEPNTEPELNFAQAAVKKMEMAEQEAEKARVAAAEAAAEAKRAKAVTAMADALAADEAKKAAVLAAAEKKKAEEAAALVVAEEARKAAEVPTPSVVKQEDMPAWIQAWLAAKKQPLPEEVECAPVCYPECGVSFWPKQLTIRHVWGDQENECIPFATNYTTVELLFASDYRLGSVMPILDVRGHRFDNNTYAANAGVGGRYIPDPSCDCFCEILGFNAYYDYRQGCIGYYQQVGIGLEVLSRRWDFRANAYAPFGARRHIQTCVFDDYDGDYFAIRQSIESISYSFNAEIGFLLFETCNEFSLYAAGGPYFLARALCNDGVVGGEVRLRPQYRDYVALDLSWRYDSLFQTIWQIEIVFNLPLYQISGQNKYPCCLSDRQIYQPIQRFEVMPLSKKTCWDSNF
jgi:hypothetical protein